MKRLLTVLSALLVSAPALAGDWLFVGGTETSVSFVDLRTVEGRDGLYRAWEQMTSLGTEINRDLYLAEYDCAARTKRYLQIHSFLDERLVASETASNLVHVAPESVAADMLDVVCKNVAPKDGNMLRDVTAVDAHKAGLKILRAN